MQHSVTKSRCLDRLRTEVLGASRMDNALRGYLCEVMVAEALGDGCKLVSKGWHPWDIALAAPGLPQALRIQVKNSAALQAWHRDGSTPSTCSFSLTYRPRPSYFERDNPGLACEPHGFLCDIYALCHHPITDPDIADHAEPSQWNVYLVPTDPALGAITEAEIAWAQGRSPRRRTIMRRPGTLERGIRGRVPIKPVPMLDLTAEKVLAASGL